MNNPNLDLFIGGSFHFKENLIIPHTTTPKKLDDLIYYYNLTCIAQPSAYYKLKLFKEVGLLNENLHFGMDLDLWIRFYQIKSLKYIISDMRIHQEQKTFALNYYAMKEVSNIIYKNITKFNLGIIKTIKIVYQYTNLCKNSYQKSFQNNSCIKYPKFIDVYIIKLIKTYI